MSFFLGLLFLPFLIISLNTQEVLSKRTTSATVDTFRERAGVADSIPSKPTNMTPRSDDRPDAPPLCIRLAQSDEYETVGALTVEAYRHLFASNKSSDDSSDNDGADRYLASLKDVASRASISEIVVAEMDGQLLGALAYYDEYAEALKPRIDKSDEMVGCAGLRCLAVHPEAQGKGIGQALVEWCLDRARRDGRKAVVLNSGDQMKTAQRLYRRLGFQLDDTIGFEMKNQSTGKTVQVIGMRYDL